MSTTRNDQSNNQKRDEVSVPVDVEPRMAVPESAAVDPTTVSDADDRALPDDVTGPAPGESLASAIDGASRPDKVAIGLMVGVVVLLLICVAFGMAAR